ncbi:MAG TPA: DNA repair protein RadA [Bacteroidia bacterium]|mgnify:CR=1 FL=1|nr:DNA repair protein RadA [Bacteroidia bacterium]
MAKVKTTFFCQNCGAQSAKWIGKCPSCNEWNTYVEEVVQTGPSQVPAWRASGKGDSIGRQAVPQLLGEIAPDKLTRVTLPGKELNRVLGGGLVPGALVLVGGEPGIGKSTLMLQIAMRAKGMKVLYVSGEESEQQISIRASRIGHANADCYILTETNTQAIFRHIETVKPNLVIIDSIQTLFSPDIESTPGTVSQIRGCAGDLLKFAKETSTPVFLIGHITKDGSIAGPKVLEHMVDTVLQFEGDRHHVYRILRSTKNRFGSTSEIGIYEMSGTGLAEVPNPSEVLLSHIDENLSGIAIACTMEGLRPLLIEVQALVSSAVYGTPQRSSTGFDLRRLSMLLAVLEKRCGFRLAAKDVFLNIAGGLRVEDPAIDLAVICAVLSSSEDISLPARVCFTGEVGLSGEIRPVNRIDQRIKEAEKMGFEKIYFSKYNKQGIDQKSFNKIELVPVAKVEEVFTSLFS